MNRAATLRWLLLCGGVGFSVGGCPIRPEADVCREKCEAIGACGLLPSPIGHDVADCSNRCELAADSTRESVLACKVGGTLEPGCEASKECANLATCLSSLSQDGGAVGRARVQLIVTGASSSSVSDLGAVTCAGGSDSAGVGATSSAVADLCREPGTVRAFVVDNGKQKWSESADCPTFFASPPVFEELSPGLVRGGIIIQRPAGPECAAFLTPTTWVDAGPQIRGIELGVGCSAAPLGSGGAGGASAGDACFVPCEGSGANCEDGIDNDSDSFTDCDDPKCNCAKSPPVTSKPLGEAGASGAGGAAH